jgi:hypothetical protein
MASKSTKKKAIADSEAAPSTTIVSCDSASELDSDYRNDLGTSSETMSGAISR